MLLEAPSSATNLSSLSKPSKEKQEQQQQQNQPTMSYTKLLSWVIGGLISGAGVCLFSTYFPFVADFTFGEISPTLYYPAWYHYDDRSLFDNTIWTFGTDYLLACVMALWALRIGAHPADPNKNIATLEFLRTHSFRSKGLLLSYSLSVLAGAIAHHLFTTVESRNTLTFRFLWTLCVGSVTAAVGWMGSIATVWAQYDQHLQCATIKVIPAWFWAAFASVGTALVALGGWSYQRPACDIFVAGITQTPCSFYAMALLWKGLPILTGLSAKWRAAAMVTFVLNAPLLPLYPLLVKTSLSLGQINAILHSWLLFAWSSQGYVLLKVAQSLERQTIPPPHAVPVMKRKAC